MPPVIAWSGTGREPEEWLAELAGIEWTDGGLHATGVQLGADPAPYRADYTLEVGPDWVTRLLAVHVRATDGERRLELRHDGSGGWTADGVPFGAALRRALDCDLAYSPLTNLMPIRRHALDRGPGTHEIVVAWVSLPDLAVHAASQSYEHLAPGLVRFRTLGPDPAFTADLLLDADGLVLDYPRLTRRVGHMP